MNVQAYILSLTYESTLDELWERIEYQGCDTITCLSVTKHDDIYEYVAPNWIAEGDIVFFYYAKSSLKTIKRLKNECENLNISDDLYTHKSLLKKTLENAEKIYKMVGGCIITVGQIVGVAEIGESVEHPHFKSKIFAPVTNFLNLEVVIPFEIFSEYIEFKYRGSITPVLGESFEKLKEDILEDNSYIDYLKNAHSVPTPLSGISDSNWLTITKEYRRKFFLEIQFRKYYVDYFLKHFGDYKKFYSECSCYRNGKLTGIADKCIQFNGKYVFIEVKLNIKSVPHIEEQLEKYCEVEIANLTDDKKISKADIVQNYVFLIDINGLYIYSHRTGKIEIVKKLDYIKAICDIKDLRQKCIERISED